MILTAILHRCDDWWAVRCAEIPAAISQGKTKEEALENLKDAIEQVLAAEREEALRSKTQEDTCQPLAFA